MASVSFLVATRKVPYKPVEASERTPVKGGTGDKREASAGMEVAMTTTEDRGDGDHVVVGVRGVVLEGGGGAVWHA